MTRIDDALSPLRRFAAVLSTWVLLNLAQPGWLRPDGFGHLAFFALAPWAWAASQPGRRAFLAEWLAHALGFLGWFLWMRHLLPWLLVPMALVPALYPACAGVLLRRLVRRFPLAVAAPVAWIPFELARYHVPPPFSFGWLRVGELMHDTLWLSGSARVWGAPGLTFVLAALGGLAADFARARRGGSLGLASFLFGVGPLFVGIGASLVVSPPQASRNLGVVVAQPGIEQSRKSGRGDWVQDIYVPLVDETLAGVDAYQRQFDADPDVVVWGESILYGTLAQEGFFEAYDRGVRPPEWSGAVERPRYTYEVYDAVARLQVAALLGDVPTLARLRSTFAQYFASSDAAWLSRVRRGARLVPERTQFVSGVELQVVTEEGLMRQNAVGHWDAQGMLLATAAKLSLVPAAEDIGPVKRLSFVVDAVQKVAGYVPDFVPGERVGVFDVPTEDGVARLAATVCYDNAFDAPYHSVLRGEPVDAFLIASNEAWYRESAEMDHLLALARMRALTTGRAVVRATNSGISAVIDGAGRDVAVLEVEGRRKMVRGHLVARVPLPADPGWISPYVRTEGLQGAGWVLLALGLAVLSGRSRRAAVAASPREP